MTKTDVEKIIKEEVLVSAYNLLEDRPDRENEVIIKMADSCYAARVPIGLCELQ